MIWLLQFEEFCPPEIDVSLQITYIKVQHTSIIRSDFVIYDDTYTFRNLIKQNPDIFSSTICYETWLQ